MKKTVVKMTAFCLAGGIALGGSALAANAKSLSIALPVAGGTLAIKEGNTAITVKKTQKPTIEITKETISPAGEEFLTAGIDRVIHQKKAEDHREEGVSSNKAPVQQTNQEKKTAAREESAVNEPEEAEETTQKPDKDQPEETAENPEAEETEQEETEQEETQEPEAEESDIAIAKVTNYVNVRDQASEEGEVVGKLYDKSAGKVVGREGDWLRIESGDVNGYVKEEFVVTGEAAVALAEEVGHKIANVTTETLRVRKEPGVDAPVLGMVAGGDILTVLEESDGWLKVDIEEGHGYISKEFATVEIEFVRAESKEAEERRLAKEQEESQKAREAAEKAERERREKDQKEAAERERKNQEAAAAQAAREEAAAADDAALDLPAEEEKPEEKTPEAPKSSGGNLGGSVAGYATQFVGNPYRYGGTSLTNGADCSGFVMSVYNNFGVNLPHSSGALRSAGYDAGGIGNAQPGDIVCYSGHVGIYIGGGQIVHASTAQTGIKISNAGYKPILSVRRIF